MSARYPNFSSSRIASFWFTTLSSARRIRSGCLVASPPSSALVAPSAPSSWEVPRTVATAACSGEALIGFVTTAPIPDAGHRGSAATSCWLTEDAKTIGRRGARWWIAAARSSPALPGISMSSLARSTRARPSAVAAVAPAGGDVCLAEGLEGPVSAIGGDPDAGAPDGQVVADRAGSRGGAGARRDDDLTGLGELHGVVEQVEQDLAEATDVPHGRLGRPGLDVVGDLEPLPGGDRADQVHNRLDAGAEIERRSLELHASCLDLREVE